MAMACLPFSIVSSPNMEPISFSLIGSDFNDAGSRPALRILTRKSTSSCLKFPVMRPLSLMVVSRRGKESRRSSSVMPRCR